MNLLETIMLEWNQVNNNENNVDKAISEYLFCVELGINRNGFYIPGWSDEARLATIKLTIDNLKKQLGKQKKNYKS